MWIFPWKYKESFSVVLGLYLSGLLLQIITAISIPALSFPFNLIFVVFIILVSLYLFRFKRAHPIVVWLSSIHASISAIVFIAFQCFCMGFIPQTESTSPVISYLGLNHIISSWPFLYAEIYFLITLALITLKRSIPFKFSNLGFILNHFGLWITVVAMMLGNGDKQKVTLNLSESKVQWQGATQTGNLIDLPLAIKLNKFKINDYNPTLVLVDNIQNNVINNKKHKAQELIEQGKTYKQGDWSCKVLQYLPDAAFFNNTFISYKSVGSVPAALIIATNISGEKVEGWISCGNYMNTSTLLRLDRQVSLAMTIPIPKKYSSSLTIYTPDKKILNTIIEVNKPIKINGWSIYQTGFDSKMGKWSTTSIVELVKDPWLIIVYFGFTLLIVGSFFLFLKRRNY